MKEDLNVKLKENNMSKERCDAVKAQLKQALQILNSGSCGAGRGVSLAITHIEDAYLRVDFHMRESGWLAGSTVPQGNAVEAPGSIMPAPVQKLPVNPANKLQTVTGVKTGLMPQGGNTGRPPEDVLDDISMLG